MNVILDVLKIVVEVMDKLVWNVILHCNFYKIINVLNLLNAKMVNNYFYNLINKFKVAIYKE